MGILTVFAVNLRRIRVERKMSQEDLAQDSGLHPTYISMLECEKRNASLKTVERLAKALDVSPAEFFRE